MQANPQVPAAAAEEKKKLHPSANKSGASSRINPAQMPRKKEDSSTRAVFETRKMEKESTSYGGDRRMMGSILSTSSGSIPPPPASSRFVVKDLGNASPRFIRSTMYQVPQTKDLRRTCEMPFAMVVTPLARCDPEDSNGGEVPLVDASAEGPVRCCACKAYMNPYVRWLDGGRRFQCNLCGSMNDTPAWYFCNMGPNGTRIDQFDRPELSHGSVEYIPSSQYVVRPPARPACVFLIDVSSEAIQSGITLRICEAILGLVESRDASIAPGKIAIATFSTNIQFITMKSSGPQMIVVPDVSSPYAPSSSKKLLLDSTSNREEIAEVLRFVIATMCNKKTSMMQWQQESCAVAAIHSAGKLIQKEGGKVIAFVASTLAGEGSNPPSSSSSASSEKASKTTKDSWRGMILGSMKRADRFTAVAEELAESQVCADIFAFSPPNSNAGAKRTSPSSSGIMRLKTLPSITGGSFLLYESDNLEGEYGRFCHDLRHNLTREQGFEALLRVRTSIGLSVETYKGSFLVRTETDVDLAGIDEDKSIVAYIKHEDSILPKGGEVCFQCALLYTTSDTGQRRIRVHTLSVPTTMVMGSIYRSADLDSQMMAILGGLEDAKDVKEAKEEATKACVGILYAYRKYCATSSATGQLILPEALKLMPIKMLGFIKGLSEGGCVTFPFVWTSLSGLDYQISPSLVALHSGGKLLSCSSEAMDDDAVLLLLENNVGYVWVGVGVYPPVLQKIFAHQDYESIQRKLDRGEWWRGEEGLLYQMVDRLCDPSRHLRLKFVARGSGAETKLIRKLIEDRTQSGMSYVEYLCHVHRQIQNRFL